MVRSNAASPKAGRRAKPPPSSRRFVESKGALHTAGASLLDIASTMGGMGLLLGRIVARTVTLKIDRDELFRNMYRMGLRSLPIVVITALFVGAIAVIQAAPFVQRVGAYGLLGWGAGFVVLRELGPLLVALMINGRVGANNTAELGTMVVTEQVDALRVLAIDPISFLVAPRFIGIVVTLFLSTVFADLLALLGAALAGDWLLGVAPIMFYRGLTAGVLNHWDVLSGILKSVIFGAIIGLSSCQFGLAVTGGAPGVGKAVNATVVASAAGMFVADYFVSFAM
jgi:phospholipid/cholesterol/gamma-HCH transport system permease protein